MAATSRALVAQPLFGDSSPPEERRGQPLFGEPLPKEAVPLPKEPLRPPLGPPAPVDQGVATRPPFGPPATALGALFAPGSQGEAPPRAVQPPQVSKEPQPVFMDAEQTWLGKLDQEARRRFPAAGAQTFARMSIVWRSLLPFCEKAVLLLGDRELKAAAQLAAQQASAARRLAQSPLPTLLERLSKALGGGKARGWFGSRRLEEPAPLVRDLRAQEPALQQAMDENVQARELAQRLHDELEAFLQAVDCLNEVGEATWKAALGARRQLLHQVIYNLELSLAHFQQQERLLLQWHEDLQRLVYLIYPNWQMGQ